MVRLALVALSMVAVLAVAAAATQAAEEKKHEGTVVSAADGKLVMTDADDKEHSHDIADTVKITRNGKKAKLTDLKAGDKVTVTTKGDEVTAIDATS
jgi:uncharacterized protein YdbL (DUF1318 family)